jgi:hypothetical protein
VLRRAGEHVAPAVEVDADDLPAAPVAEPQPAVVPTRGLAEDDVLQQDGGRVGSIAHRRTDDGRSEN